jgi:hypothetical protein
VILARPEPLRARFAFRPRKVAEKGVISPLRWSSGVTIGSSNASCIVSVVLFALFFHCFPLFLAWRRFSRFCKALHCRRRGFSIADRLYFFSALEWTGCDRNNCAAHRVKAQR